MVRIMVVAFRLGVRRAMPRALTRFAFTQELGYFGHKHDTHILFYLKFAFSGMPIEVIKDGSAANHFRVQSTWVHDERDLMNRSGPS